MVSCGKSTVCFFDLFCLDRPSTLICGIIAFIIGVYGSHKIRNSTSSPTSGLYSILWFTFSVMMTISGVLHSIVGDYPAKGELSFLSWLRPVMSFVNVWLTSSIGAGFGVAGVFDLLRKDANAAYFAIQGILFMLWLFNFIFDLRFNFYLYVVPVSIGCLLFLVCQIILYVSAQSKLQYPKSAVGYKDKWLALLEVQEQGGSRTYFYHPVKALFFNRLGSIAYTANTTDEMAHGMDLVRNSQNVDQYGAQPDFNRNTFQSNPAYSPQYVMPNASQAPLDFHNFYQSNGAPVFSPNTAPMYSPNTAPMYSPNAASMYQMHPPPSQNQFESGRTHTPHPGQPGFFQPQPVMPIGPIFANPYTTLSNDDPSLGPFTGPFFSPSDFSKQEVPFVDFNSKKANLPGFLSLLLGGLSGFVGMLFFIPLAKFWCDIVGFLHPWLGPEFMWFIGSDLAMLFLASFLIESDSLRHSIVPNVVGDYQQPSTSGYTQL